MAKKRERFEVPAEFRHEYKMLIQRANRRIKSNLKYIEKNGIDNEHTIRSLVGGFDDVFKWQTGRSPLSRSNRGRYIWNADTGEMEFRDFQNKTEFEQYLKYLSKWGEEGRVYQAHPESVKKDYKTAIIRSLNEIKDHYNISLPNGQIPKEVLDSIDSMNLTEITNFFGNGDPSEDIEISQFSSDDFIYVETAEDFIDVIVGRIESIKKYY